MGAHLPVADPEVPRSQRMSGKMLPTDEQNVQEYKNEPSPRSASAEDPVFLAM